MKQNKNQKTIKWIAVITCVCFVLSLVFSFAYEVREINHECSGLECPICAQIQASETNRQQLSTVIHTRITFLFAFVFYVFSLLSFAHHICIITPVSLKVKMNN